MKVFTKAHQTFSKFHRQKVNLVNAGVFSNNKSGPNYYGQDDFLQFFKQQVEHRFINESQLKYYEFPRSNTERCLDLPENNN